jgi:DNA-directed RNA polymerase beta subunit
MHAHDFHSQELAKHEERTWGVSLVGDVSLVDKETGQEINRTKMKLGILPKLTSRYSFIVDGGEWQVITQWRLKSGIYGKLKENGQYEAEFNLAKTFVNEGRIKIPFDPETKKLKLNYATTNIPLYSVLKAQGVEDHELESKWGKDILAANKSRDWQKDIKSFYLKLARRGVKAQDPNDFESIRKAVVDQFHAAEVLPETSKLTVGQPHTTVNSAALMDASTHIIDIAKGTKKPDDVYSLEYKNLMALNDFIKEKFGSKKIQNSLKSKIRNNIDKKTRVSDIISIDLFNKPLKNVFVGHTLAQRPDQVNPLDILSSRGLTTIYGIGGIQNEQAVRNSMKVISHSHLGFLDPIHTPEGEGTGISLHLPLGVHKFGNEPKTYVFDRHEDKFKYINSLELHSNHTVLPDQVKYKDGKPYPVGDKIKMLDPKTHEFIEEPINKARYIMVSSKGMFDEATNLIPFLQCNQGNRTMTGSKQPSQSIGLVHREAPLVQVKSNSAKTFEEVFAEPFVQKTRVDGTVHSIEKDKLGYAHTIILKDDKGEFSKIPLYNHFPLNDKKSFLHSHPVVKEGDKVKAGDLVADNNFSKGGVLSLGTNIKVAYSPHYGGTFEDGVVISESASKKFTSEHLHKLPLEIDMKKDVIGTSKYQAYVSSVGKKITKESMKHLDSEGVVKLGAKVKPGDLLIAGVRKTDMTGQLAMVGSKVKGAVQPYKDNSLVWNSDYEGEVVKVVKKPNEKGYTVYVKTLEPAQIGDKIADRHGAKQIIGSILPDAHMPKIGGPDGKPVEVMMNPISVAGRFNIGQLLETGASKIAEKTGKPYIVNNFISGGMNYTDKVKSDLKEHGISDTEKLWDPITKKYVDNEILVGNKYMFKLKHQVEKKLSVRGMDNKTYSVNQEPRGGGGDGAQAIGQLEMYALLAHGARENIKEITSYKAERPHDSQMRDTNFWDLVMRGMPLPPPKPTFAYRKFESYLTGLGLNIHKDGFQHTVQPLTDKGVLALSNGEIKEAFKIRGKNEKEVNRGLFDVKITGGVANEPGKGLKYCFAPETPVLTNRGYIPIGTIVDCELDVLVLSWNELTRETEWKRINNYWEHETDDECVELEYETGTVTCTINHKFYSPDGLVTANELKEGLLISY